MANGTLNASSISRAIQAIDALDLRATSVQEIEELIISMMPGCKMQIPNFHPNIYLYRGRICEKPSNIRDLSYPHAGAVTEVGRVNDLKDPIFYAATTRGVPFFELRPHIGQTVAMSVWKSTDRMALSHVGFTNECTRLLKSTRSLSSIYDFVRHTNNFGHLNEMVHSYFASKFIEHVPVEEAHRYKVTIAIARRLMAGPYIDGLMYPSIAMAGNVDNIALKPSYFDKHLQFVSVEYVQVIKSSLTEFQVQTLDTATHYDEFGQLRWSDREFEWQISEDKGQVTFQIIGDDIVAIDEAGNRIDPR